MSKYKIKNCPSYDPFLQEPTCNRYACDCQTKTDCLLKQITEYCKTTRDVYCYGQKHNIRWIDANNILKKFDIQEVE